MFYFSLFSGKKILKSSFIDECFFTTRDFVLTPSARKDLEKTASENMNQMLKTYNGCRLITAEQVHGDKIEIVNDNISHYPETDAIISNIKDTILMLNFADCTPIILYSKKDKTGALIHAGWRGSAKKITPKTVIKMQEQLNIKPENIAAVIGPSIGKCCFETDEDVFEKLIDDKNQTNLYNRKGKKFFIDLKLLNMQQLYYTGVKNIDICDYCTCCMSDIFFSYRKEKGITARHSAILKI